MIQNILHT